MARRRRAARRRGSGFALPQLRMPEVGPEVARSIAGITLLVLGAVTLIALLLQGQGSLTTWWINTVAPWFGSLRWVLPILLLGGGWYMEWGPGKTPGSGWGLTLVGIAVAYAGLLGAATVIVPAVVTRGVVTRGAAGGRIGTFLADSLSPLLTSPGAFIVLVAIAIVGILLAFNLRLRDLTRPATRVARWAGMTAAASIQREPRPGDPVTEPGNGKGGGVRNGGRARPPQAGRHCP